jgi:hypothetical protein
MQRVSCEGAPRDLGLDQGRACRDAIRADARALGWEVEGGWLGALRARRGAGPAPALARDLARHFPHLDERVTGLAAGAGLPREALLVLLEEEIGSDGVVAGAGVDAGLAPRLAVRLREPLPPTGLVACAVRADGGYPVLALTRPSLGAALAGVNERGLAGAVLLLDPPARAGDRCGAPGALLLDQCLERLDTVEKALDWCEHRPGGGRARLFFADAAGAVAAIEIDGEQRSRVEPGPEGVREGHASLRLDPAARALELSLPGVAPERLVLAGDAPQG